MRTIKSKFLLSLFIAGLVLLISGCAGRESAYSRVNKNYKKKCEESISRDRAAANRGSASAQFSYGLKYFNGSCVAKNYTESMKWFRMADRNGNAKAANYMGNMYQNGWGVPKDVKEAQEWFRKGSDKGDIEATANLGQLYFRELKNYSEGFKMFQKAAAKGHKKSKLSVGLSYYGGLGVKQDFHEAERIFLSLTSGKEDMSYKYPEANFFLGSIYEKGFVGPKDLKKALYRYKKASKRGHAKAREAVRRLQPVPERSQDAFGFLFPPSTTDWTAGELRVKELKVPTTDFESFASGMSGTKVAPHVRLQLMRRYMTKGNGIEMIIDTYDPKTVSTIILMFEKKEFRAKMAKEGAHIKMIKKFHAITGDTGQEKALILNVGKAGIVALACEYKGCEKDMEEFSKGLNLNRIERFNNSPHRKSEKKIRSEPTR